MVDVVAIPVDKTAQGDRFPAEQDFERYEQETHQLFAAAERELAVIAAVDVVEQDYTLGKLRYDPGKLRAHRLAERVGTGHRYRMTADGVRLGVLLVKIRTRLLGPIFAVRSQTPSPRSEHPSTVEAALRTVDHALDNLCHTLGLSAA